MNNIRIFRKYIGYKLFSKHKTGHGIHSPFVFDLISKVFQDKNEYAEYSIVERLKARLLNEERKIKITFFGAGSKYNRKNFRKLNSIARTSSIEEKYGRLLFRLVKYFKPNNILELGTSVGVSASYMAFANKESAIHTIEGCKNILEIAKTNFRVLALDNIITYNNSFDSILGEILEKTKSVDFVFIDGDHKKNAILNYFNKIKEYINNNSIIVIDDIRWSKEMEEAWKIIKNDDKVTVTIDLFFMGIAFFRSESSKQNFLINF